MTVTDAEQVAVLVQPALDESYVYDVSHTDALILLSGGTIWARIKGESSAIHLVGLDSGCPRVALGWAN